MTLTIHRGTHEIGGSCVEIRTDKAKILIDLGMPLDYDKHTTEEQGQIRSDAAEWCKGVDALFLSHAHADHYGFLDLLPQDTPIYATEESFAMLALDDIGTALYELRQYIRRLQEAHHQEALLRADAQKSICLQ